MTQRQYDRLKYRQGGLLQSLVKKITRNTSPLVKSLHSYSPYTPPHKGRSIDLNAEQAEENFRYFQQVKSERVALIRQLLAIFSLDINPQKINKDSLLRLDEWAYQQWPAIYNKSLAMDGLFSFAFNDKEKLAVRSMLFDLGILLGECYLNLHPKARWYLDAGLEPGDEQRGTCNRIVLLETMKSDKEDDWDYMLDIEDHVFFHYELQTKANQLLLVDQKIGNVLGKPILESLS